MTLKTKNFVLALAAALTTLCAAGVQAAGDQPAPPPPAGARPPMQPMANPEVMKARMTERLEALGTALKIKPEQKTAWESFKAAHLSRKDEADKAPAEAPKTAVEAMKRREDMLRKNLEVLEKVRKSAETLYAQLDAEQKATFDSQLQNGGGRHDGAGRGPRQGR